MNLPENNRNSAAVQEYKQPLDFVSDFEGVQIYLDRVANLMQLYREMLDTDWDYEEEPRPYVMEAYWKRRELYFSQFEAIEILFLDALKEMTKTVKNAYDYCWKARKGETKQDGLHPGSSAEEHSARL